MRHVYRESRTVGVYDPPRRLRKAVPFVLGASIWRRRLKPALQWVFRLFKWGLLLAFAPFLYELAKPIIRLLRYMLEPFLF
jgi:hypothetical protein